MTQPNVTYILARLCDYLLASGIELTDEVTLEVLHLLHRAFTSAQKDRLAFVMARVHQAFDIKDVNLPIAAPPIVRGSIEYGA